MLMSIEMSIIPYISTKCRWRRQWFTLFARRDEKRNSHWERLGLPLSLRLGKWNFYNNLVLSNAGDPYITENITHNSHQNIHIVNQNIDRKKYKKNQ